MPWSTTELPRWPTPEPRQPLTSAMPPPSPVPHCTAPALPPPTPACLPHLLSRPPTLHHPCPIAQACRRPPPAAPAYTGLPPLPSLMPSSAFALSSPYPNRPHPPTPATRLPSAPTDRLPSTLAARLPPASPMPLTGLAPAPRWPAFHPLLLRPSTSTAPHWPALPLRGRSRFEPNLLQPQWGRGRAGQCGAGEVGRRKRRGREGGQSGARPRPVGSGQQPTWGKGEERAEEGGLALGPKWGQT